METRSCIVVRMHPHTHNVIHTHTHSHTAVPHLNNKHTCTCTHNRLSHTHTLISHHTPTITMAMSIAATITAREQQEALQQANSNNKGYDNNNNSSNNDGCSVKHHCKNKTTCNKIITKFLQWQPPLYCKHLTVQLTSLTWAEAIAAIGCSDQFMLCNYDCTVQSFPILSMRFWSFRLSLPGPSGLVCSSPTADPAHTIQPEELSGNYYIFPDSYPPHWLSVQNVILRTLCLMPEGWQKSRSERATCRTGRA